MSEITPRQLELIDLADELAEISVFDADALGFGPRCLVSATLPYQKPRPENLENGCWVRRNGKYTLWVQGGPAGVPYGAYPRLFAIWLTCEAVRTGSRSIHTGPTFKGFCRLLHIDSSRGKRGSGRYMRDSIDRLLSSLVGFRIDDESRIQSRPLLIADEFDLWWDTSEDLTHNLKEGHVVLSEPFFNEITRHYIPVDLRVVGMLTRSPLALDIYQWLAYRYYNMDPRVRSVVTWDQLRAQFGNTYTRMVDFRRAFQHALRQVRAVYPQARLELTAEGVTLQKSPTPVPALELIRP